MTARQPSTPPLIGGYSYVRTLGSGGFSDVFLYEQALPRRQVAVKVLLAGLASNRERRSFEAEANLMALLSTHPSIVTIYQADIAGDGRPYIAMEYCGRPSLDARFRRERISVDEALRIGIHVAGAVETAHRAGILHRDIKPANILVTDYNNPALTDFGIASTLFGDDIDDTQGLSIPWSPPEVFGEAVPASTTIDIYALGATVYSLLAGRSPFELPGQSNTSDDIIERIQSVTVTPTGRPDVPASLEAALARCMAKEPTERFRTALDFARALQRVQVELSIAVTTVDVLEESSDLDLLIDELDELDNVHTRALVPPASAPLASASFPELESGLDFEHTVLRRPQPAPSPEPEHGSPVRPPGRRIALGVWIALMVVVGGGSVLAVVSGQPASSTAASVEDAGQPPAVPDVTGLAAATGPAGITFTWTDPAIEDGDRFLWGVVTPGAETDLGIVAEPTVTVPADPSGRTCVEVVLARRAGAASAGLMGCTP